MIFQECRLPCSIRANQHRALAAFHGEVETGVNFVRAIGHVDAFQ